MAKRISPQFVEELNSRVNIVDVIHARVPLKKAGKDYQACCPFHAEKTPSFTVSAQKQFYYCFGCGAKGGALKFLMEFEHLSFVDAVEKLAEENGMQVKYEVLSKSAEQRIERRKTLVELLLETTEIYEKNLYHQQIGAEARQYLNERQLDKETCQFFRLGYSKNQNTLQNHFGTDRATDEDLLKTGLLATSERGHYDFFRNRLMFPIRDVRGQVLGFGARSLGDAKPKYLNTGDTELFNKSHVLYGLYEELQSNRNIERLIVVEGYMDVIALHQMGVKGAVAALGTAFTQGHLNLVRKFSKKIFICFDGDAAGKKAAKRAMQLILPAMTTDTEIRMVFLPDGEDPDTLVRKIGKVAFNEVLTAGQYFSEFVCQTIIADSDLNLIEGRGEMAVRAKALFDSLPADEYKTALYQELTERAGRDIYQLVKEAQQPITTTDKAIKTPPVVRVSRRQVSLQSRLVRLLLVSPELAGQLRHERLLMPIEDNERLDSSLLYHLIQYLQFNDISKHQDSESALSELVQVLPLPLRQRLQQILQTEKLVEFPNEPLEQRKQRLYQEFSAGFEKLINDRQQKNYRRSLKKSG